MLSSAIASPDMAIRTTLFFRLPGETESDHRQLMEFVEENRLRRHGRLRIFAREGTVAGTMGERPKARSFRPRSRSAAAKSHGLQQKIASAGRVPREQFDEKKR